MNRDAMLAKRRIQFIVRECSSPGLIAKLSQIPEGWVNVFIRAVLTEWFLSNGDSAESASHLIDEYRVIEFRNANGIKFGEYSNVLLASPMTASLAARVVQHSLPADRAVSYSVSQDEPSLGRGVTSAELMTLIPLSVPPATPPAIHAPILDVEFDPDVY